MFFGPFHLKYETFLFDLLPVQIFFASKTRHQGVMPHIASFVRIETFEKHMLRLARSVITINKDIRGE